jgi:hypothetical protein
METPRRRTDIPTFPAGMRLEIERSKCRCIRTNGAVASTEHVGTRISLQVVMTGPTDDLVSTAAAQCALAARGDQVLLLGGLGGLLLLIEEPELHLSPYGSRRRWAREKNWRSAERGRFRSSVSSRVSTRFLRFVRRSARAEMWHGERRCETLGRDSHISRRVAGAVRRSSSVQRLTLGGLA